MDMDETNAPKPKFFIGEDSDSNTEPVDEVEDDNEAKFLKFIKQKPCYDGYYFPPISDKFLVGASRRSSMRNDYDGGSAYHGQRRRSRSKSPELRRLCMKIRQKRRSSAPDALAGALGSSYDVMGLLQRGRIDTPTTIPGNDWFDCVDACSPDGKGVRSVVSVLARLIVWVFA